MRAWLAGVVRRTPGWLGSHTLQIRSLPGGARIATALAIGVLGVGAAAMVAVWFRGPRIGLLQAQAPGTGLLALGTVAAIAALGLGVPLIVAGSSTLQGQWPRAVRMGAAVIGLAACGTGLAAADGQLLLLTTPATALVRLPLWAGMGVALVLLLPAVGTTSDRWTPTMAGIPFLCLTVGGLAQGLLTGNWARAAITVDYGMALLAFVGIAVGAALLFWLAVEGLRLSRDVGVALLRLRVSPARLVLGLVCLKAGLLTLVWSVSAAGSGPDALPVIDALTPPPATLLAAAPFVAAALWLLTREERFGFVERHFLQATRGLGTIFLIILSPVILIGTYLIGTAFASDAFRVLGLALLIAAAVWSSKGQVRSRWWTRVEWLVGAVLLASCAPLLARFGPVRGLAESVSQAMTGPELEITVEWLGRSLLVALIACAALVVLVVLARPAFRPAGIFLLAVLAWGLPTVMLPGVHLSLGAFAVTLPAVDPVAFDVVLGAAAVALVIAWQRRWQTAIRPAELVVLMVASTAIVYGSTLKSLLPAGLAESVVPFAFILPALTQLTLDSGALNVDGPHRARRVLATIGVICTSFGMVLALMLFVGRSSPIVNALVEVGSALALMPLAVVLAASTSASLGATGQGVNDAS